MTSGDLSSRGRGLFSAARHAHEPTAANRAHVKWAVERRVLEELNAPPKRGWRRVLAFGVGVGALAVAGTATAWLLQGFVVNAPAPLTDTQAGAIEAPLLPRTSPGRIMQQPDPEPAQAEPPRAEPPAVERSTRRHSRPAEPPASSEGPSLPRREQRQSLAAETALIAEAQAATNRGQGEQALRALERYDRQHAQGLMTEERSAARILALCAASKTRQARQEAARFLSRWPRSPQVAGIHGSCARTNTRP